LRERQRQFAPGIAAEPGPQGVPRHHHRREGQCRRRYAATAGRHMGYASRNPIYPARLRSRCAKNRNEARQIMQKLGYGADKRLGIKMSTRDLPFYRDTAVILIDQLEEVFFDGELETIDTTNWYPKLTPKVYSVGVNFTGNGIDDPDQNLYENYTCCAEGNHNGYCNPELDKLVDPQSMEADQ